MSRKGVRFSIVGPGRVGSSLGRALVEEGWCCDTVIGAIDRVSERREVKKYLGAARFAASLTGLGPEFDILFVTVGDDQVENVAKALGDVPGISWDGKVVLHASGIVEVDALSRLKNSGAMTGALHPVSAFASRFAADAARDIYYDFLGDPQALPIARRITKLLSSKLLLMRTEKDRLLLHTASVVVSNFTVIGMLTARRMISGFSKESDAKVLLDKLLKSTVGNLARRTGSGSLTGPLARGDLSVIRKHLESLESDSSLLQFYKSASLLGIKSLLADELDPDRKRNLLKIKDLLEAE